MAVYRLAVHQHKDSFEVIREQLNPETKKVITRSIYSSTERLPYRNMGDTMKSIARILKHRGMNLNEDETKALMIRDTFELYREDLNPSSLSPHLAFVHKVIPKSIVFDTTWERWDALNLTTQESVLAHLHDFHRELDRLFLNPLLSRSATSPVTLSPAESKKLVENAAAQSVNSTQFRNAIVGVLSALATAGVVNYWPQIKEQLLKRKELSAQRKPSSSKPSSKPSSSKPSSKPSSSKPSSSHRKKHTKRKTKK